MVMRAHMWVWHVCVLTMEVYHGPFVPAQCAYEIASGCGGAHNVLDH